MPTREARKMDYGVWFLSPRGFANEGMFAYGSKVDFQLFFESYSGKYASIYKQGNNSTLMNARKSAYHMYKNAGNATTENYTSVASISRLIADAQADEANAFEAEMWILEQRWMNEAMANAESESDWD